MNFKNKYLKDFNFDDLEDLYKDDKKKIKKMKKQNKEYGLSYVDTYDLQFSIAAYLYTALNMYYDNAKDVIDFHYHKIFFNYKWYDEEECIKYMLYNLKFFLKNYNVYDEEASYRLKNALAMLSECSDMLWW